MKVVVAITGASGSIVGLRLIEELKKKKVEVITLITEVGKKVTEYETGKKIKPDYNEDEMIFLLLLLVVLIKLMLLLFAHVQ
jgi:4-hydroxy-3-polyprenylbenzoate decarboxylase